MFTRLIDFLKRSPRAGDGKELPMPTELASPQIASPPPPEAGAPPTLSHLADALRELAQSQKALMDAVARATTTPPTPAPGRPAVASSSSIAGDPGDGLRPSVVVDYSRLSPLQQIAMGLRGAPAPVTRTAPAKAPTPVATRAEESECVPAGAD